MRLGFYILTILPLIFPFLGYTKVIELFEDDPKFIDLLPRMDTPTKTENESKDVFHGKIAVKVICESPGANNNQRYNPRIPGWNYKIVKNPSKEDEARWIMFAWKKKGGTGIIPDNGRWGPVTVPCAKPPTQGRRYIAGQNATGWTGICLKDEIPEDWEVVVRDLYSDFGEFTMTGLALTPFNGEYGLYDSIYLAWTEDELRSLLKEWTTRLEPRGKLATSWGRIKEGW